MNKQNLNPSPIRDPSTIQTKDIMHRQAGIGEQDVTPQGQGYTSSAVSSTRPTTSSNLELENYYKKIQALCNVQCDDLIDWFNDRIRTDPKDRKKTEPIDPNKVQDVKIHLAMLRKIYDLKGVTPDLKKVLDPFINISERIFHNLETIDNFLDNKSPNINMNDIRNAYTESLKELVIAKEPIKNILDKSNPNYEPAFEKALRSCKYKEPLPVLRHKEPPIEEEKQPQPKQPLVITTPKEITETKEVTKAEELHQGVLTVTIPEPKCDFKIPVKMDDLGISVFADELKEQILDCESLTNTIIKPYIPNSNFGKTFIVPDEKEMKKLEEESKKLVAETNLGTLIEEKMKEKIKKLKSDVQKELVNYAQNDKDFKNRLNQEYLRIFSEKVKQLQEDKEITGEISKRLEFTNSKLSDKVKSFQRSSQQGGSVSTNSRQRYNYYYKL